MFRLLHELRTSRSATGIGRSRPIRLRLQPLEDRLAPATFTVNSPLDNLTLNDGKITLREAITKANERVGADVIVVPAGVFKIELDTTGDDANLGGDFDITDTVTIVGRGAVRTIVDGMALDRVFHVRGNSPSSIRVHFRGLTIKGGRAFDGGGLLMGNSDVAMSACVVTVNKAVWSGGGISNFSNPASGNLSLIGSIISDNVSEGGDGGGIYLDRGDLAADRTIVSGNWAKASGGGVAGSTIKFTRSTISWNTASTLWAGGVGGTSVTLAVCSVTDNRAKGSGGGVYAGGLTTLDRCNVLRNVSGENGGGVYVNNAGIRASYSNFNSNWAYKGGGLYANTAEVVSSTIANNRALSEGGGIHASTAILTETEVILNRTEDFTYYSNLDYRGGGICATNLLLKQCKVRGNFSELGGGAYAPTATIAQSDVSDNEAALDGGGIYTDTAVVTGSVISNNSAGREGGGVKAGTANFTGCAVIGNNARGGVVYPDGSGDYERTNGSGGGIYSENVNLTNTTVSQNSAQWGGGVYTTLGVFLNSTIAENSANSGAGVYQRRKVSGDTDTVNLRNTLVALNVSSGTNSSPDVVGYFTSLGHNLIGVIANGSNGFGSPGDLLGTASKPLDPLLGELRILGGKTPTYALLAGSPAIDSGDNSGAPSTDQRGVPRPRDGNRDGKRVIDIGAFEL